MANATIEQITKTGVGPQGQAKFSNVQFAEQFKTKAGRAPTQQELTEFTEVRSSLRKQPQAQPEQRTEVKEEVRTTGPTPQPRQQFQPAQPTAVQPAPRVVGGIDFDAQQQALDTEFTQTNQILEQQKKLLDAALGAQVSGIQQSFERRKAQMEDINERTFRGLTQLGIRSGRQRFAPEIQTSILSAEERSGLQRLSDLDAQEKALIAEAQNASSLKQLALLDRKMDEISQVNDKKRNLVLQQNELARQAEKDLMERAREQRAQQKFDMEVIQFEEQAAERALARPKPIVVSPGSSLFDPSTGELIGTAPRPLDTKAPTIKIFGGRVHQWSPISQSWQDIGPEDAPNIDLGGKDIAEVSDWANNISEGIVTIKDVPADIRGAVNSALANLPPKKEDVSEVQEKIDQLEDLKAHKGLNSAVGPTKFQRIPILDITGAKADFIAGVQQLLSEKTLQSLVDAKADGATFGALSEGELKILEESSTRIGNWVQKNEEGRITGYAVSQKMFKKELDRIIGSYSKLLKETAGEGTPTSTFQQKLDDHYINNPDQRAQIDAMESAINPATSKPFTNEEKAQILGIDFRTPLSSGLNGSRIQGKKLSLLKNGQTELNIGEGTVTAIDGSRVWKPGLDFVLAGGRGADVPAPVSGEVTFVGTNKGFGNQVRIKTEDGNTMWVSHLQDFSVNKGDRITEGQILGKQGNTGNILGSDGRKLNEREREQGLGTHLDITIKKPDGSFFKAREVAALLGDRRLA